MWQHLGLGNFEQILVSLRWLHPAEGSVSSVCPLVGCGWAVPAPLVTDCKPLTYEIENSKKNFIVIVNEVKFYDYWLI